MRHSEDDGERDTAVYFLSYRLCRHYFRSNVLAKVQYLQKGKGRLSGARSRQNRSRNHLIIFIFIAFVLSRYVTISHRLFLRSDIDTFRCTPFEKPLANRENRRLSLSKIHSLHLDVTARESIIHHFLVAALLP